MKNLISLLLSCILISNVCYADCDWSKIVTNSDGTYTYSKELNQCVGQMVQDNQTKAKQVQDLMKAVQLKDAALKTADTRADNWMNTSLKLEENVQKIDSYKKQNEWIYFGLGALTVFASGMAAASLTSRH